MKSLLLIHILLFFMFSCDTTKYSEVPLSKFEGTWELYGRNMFNGIQINIVTDDKGSMTGHIVKLNEHKLIKMFVDSNDVWISSISRKSNYQFKLTEKKIARELFSLYGLSSSQEFSVEFIDDNTFGLSKGGADPKVSEVLYKRIDSLHSSEKKN